MTYLLAVDSGNTRIKWGLHDGHGWLQQGVVAQSGSALLGQEWQSLPEPARIMVSNVAGEQTKTELARLFSRWEAKPQWVAASAYQCGVRNYYADPAQLGSDRWAALVAAWRLQRQGCLVVNAGTAMTVDALSDTGEFLGGIIVPGLELMQKALTANTASLKLGAGEFRDYPDSTADAIYSGGVQALAGAVERMVILLTATLGHAPDCIMSGGAAPLLLARLNIPARIADNLVLEGLVAIAEETTETPL